MRLILCENYEDLSKQAAKLVASQVILKPDSVLGFATGSTPVGLYQNLIRYYEQGELDFSKIVSFNLDEYYPISPENNQSYRYFMNENLFDHINLPRANSFLLSGEADDVDRECQAYEQKIAAYGGIDLQILGIGQNGHIAFNEPEEHLVAKTHVTGLTESTIQANARFFHSAAEVPTKALTMGMATILKSRKIILLANGKAKHKAVTELLGNTISTQNPSTLLHLHPDVVVLCDKEAYEG
ncbi:MAG: glucosamine-6-phosphate deaminase [Oscillibacter sp.]